MGAQGLKVSVYLEAQKAGQPGAESDLMFLVTQRANHPAWLKVGLRPVVFLYAGALRDLPAAGWRRAAKAVAAAGHPEPILVGDLDPQKDRYDADSAPLDGTHMYMPTPFMAGRTPAQVEAFAATAYSVWKQKAAGKIQCLTVMPGYNDTKVPGRPLPRPIVERYGADMLAASWRSAIKASPDWVLVTSFNAWNDGTEIEPSRQWGRLTLDANRLWAERFLKL
jgi:hypothetical protein